MRITALDIFGKISIKIPFLLDFFQPRLPLESSSFFWHQSENEIDGAGALQCNSKKGKNQPLPSVKTNVSVFRWGARERHSRDTVWEFLVPMKIMLENF